MKSPIVLGHRGFSRLYPENSLIAFEKAIESGADGIECDVQKTRDNHFIIFHDPNTKRLTGKPGALKELALSQLGQYQLPYDQKIPLLSEVFQTVPSDATINLEIKKTTVRLQDIPRLIQEIKSCHKGQKLLISSFDGSLLRPFNQEGFQTGLLIGSVRFFDIIRGLIWLFLVQPHYVNLSSELASFGFFSRVSFIPNTLKKMGKKIAFWNIRTKKDLIHCLPTADILIADDPTEIIQWMQEINRLDEFAVRR